MPKYLRTFALTCFVAALLSLSAKAQENTAPVTARDFEMAPQIGKPGWRASADSGYVGGSAAKFGGTRLGDSDAFNFILQASTRLSLNEEWSLNFGLRSDNFYLDQVAGAPIPEEMHTFRFSGALGYRWNEKWTFTGLLSPSLYRFEDVNISDVGLSGGVLARYEANPSLIWLFGIIVAPDTDVKALPIVGVRWLINDHYALEVGMPKTRLSYRFDSKWAFYGGLDLNGTTFRANEHLGTETGFPRYDNALATYRDIRFGVGTSYEVMRGIHAEIETGISVYREIYYSRIEEQVRFQPAPYVRLGLSARF
jgi:Domain of unknown function (DUF6268)